jgi:hypothetical protein
MEDLQIVEHVCRTDPNVIEQCVISGIPKEDMNKVYCDREYILPSREGSLANIFSHQLGRLDTTRDSEAMFDCNKHLCITDHI